MASSGMLHHVALVRTDVSEELSASFIRVTRRPQKQSTIVLIYETGEGTLLYVSQFISHIKIPYVLT
jgi:hypothetical protein